MNEVIGEGTYGCVHKPSLKCKYKKNIDYDGKISKIMEKEEATNELLEYKKIKRADKHKDFYLGKPLDCNPKKTKKSMKAIDKCNDFKGKNIDDYKLLIMNDGGLSLEHFGEKIKKGEKTLKDIEMFFIEAHRLLYGLLQMKEYGLIHHDLKPQNIVYNCDKNRINFIDFGMMTEVNEVVDDAKNNNYSLGIPYWYFPIESMFVNKVNYTKMANFPTSSAKLAYINKLLKMNFSDISLHRNYFYKYVKNESFTSDHNEKNFLKSLSQLQHNNYELFVNKFVNTFDIYGVGLSLMFILNKSKSVLSSNMDLYNKLQELFKNMITGDFFNRYEIEEVISSYEDILEETILKKYGFQFENNKLKKRKTTIDTIFNSISKTINSIRLSKSDEKSLKTNPVKKCKDNKIVNPVTNRCVKKCKKGQTRNKKFRCVKNKTVKSPY